MGADIGVSYGLPWTYVDWLRPYATLGIADVSTLFIIGDDLLVMQNTEHPWWGICHPQAK